MQTFKAILSYFAALILRAWKDRIGRRVLLGGLSVTVVLLFLLIYRPTHRLRLTIEAGSELPDPITLTETLTASYLNEADADLSVPGVYRLKIKTNKGKYYLRLKIVDTVAPEGVIRPLSWGLGTPFPKPEEFFSSIIDASAVTVTYITANRAPSGFGTQTVELLLTDLGGNTAKYSAELSLIEDRTPPTVTTNEISGYIGYGIAYAGGVTAIDDCCGELTVTWDTSKVDTETVGKYPVYYTVTDASGNSTRVEGVIYIYEEEISPEKLYVLVDAILDEIITVDMSTVDRVRAVYDFVYHHVAYTGSSDKSDWVHEAYLALQTGNGDCFSYFALSKAFFERLGLENLDIQRTRGLTEDRHYWNMVNVGTKESPKWYYFDTTHLNTSNTGGEHSGCLLTEKQIMAYNHFRAHFYTFDHTGYPEAATEIITPTPSLEPYY